MRLPISVRLLAVAFLGTILLTLVPNAAHAQKPVVDFTGGLMLFANLDVTFGFTFTVTSPQTITALGLFDANSDGLTNSHQVGLFNSSGTLLTSTTISNALGIPAASTSSAGRYLQRAITPIALTSGTYVLGATYIAQDADGFIGSGNQQNAVPSSPPGFSFGESRFSDVGAALLFPTRTVPGVAYFGPMAFISSGAPEPPTLPLLGIGLTAGLGTVCGVKRRIRKPGGFVRVARL